MGRSLRGCSGGKPEGFDRDFQHKDGKKKPQKYNPTHPQKRPGMNYLMKSWFLLQFPEDSGCGKVFHGRSRGNERYFPKRLSQKSPFKGREIHLEKRGIKGKYFCGTSAFSQVPSGEEPGKARGWGAPVPRKGRKGEKEPRDPRKNWLQRGWDLGKIVNKFIQIMNFAFPGRGNPGVSPGVSPGDPKCLH